MRYGRRAKLLAGIGTALGLCAAGAGCQTAAPKPVPPGPPVTMGAPVALKPAGSPGWTARAAAPSGTSPGDWRPSPSPAQAPRSGVVGVAYQGPDPLGEPPGVRLEGLPALTTAPEPVRGQPPEGRKGPDKELPVPQPLLAAPPTLPPGAHPIGDGGVPRELDKRALPPYRIEPPDILLVEVLGRKGLLKNDQPIRGQHLVRPDGTIGLGIYGEVFVGGLTVQEAREAVAAHLRTLRRQRSGNGEGTGLEDVLADDVNVDVLAYNSHFYYVITDGGGYGEQVFPFAVTGSETVLDALGRVNGLPPVADKCRIWVARRGPGGAGQILPVDWRGVAARGGAGTNYQIMPGDRIYVQSDPWIRGDSWIAKRLAPIERVFGAILLGSETVNSIRSGRTGGSTGP
jgi:polysaccharide export outer membrane protein